MPTLLLWAGGNDDVWSVTRAAVAYALPLIVDSNMDLDSSEMDFNWHGPIVSVVRPYHITSTIHSFDEDEQIKASQRLCDWRRDNIGSTALAIIMTFLQCADSDREARDMADMLLESFAFLYKDLEVKNPNYAFRSHFMLQLVNMAHLQYVNAAANMHPAIPIIPHLHTYFGVLGLCGAAVSPIKYEKHRQ